MSEDGQSVSLAGKRVSSANNIMEESEKYSHVLSTSVLRITSNLQILMFSFVLLIAFSMAFYTKNEACGICGKWRNNACALQWF